MSDYLKDLEEIFKDVLELEEVNLSNETTSDDLDGWDSVNHIYLVVEIEKFYKIKFKTVKIQQWQNVGDMVNAIELALN